MTVLPFAVTDVTHVFIIANRSTIGLRGIENSVMEHSVALSILGLDKTSPLMLDSFFRLFSRVLATRVEVEAVADAVEGLCGVSCVEWLGSCGFGGVCCCLLWFGFC